MQTARKMAVMPERIRRLPRGFGWVDHRLVRERRFTGCSCAALALYVTLVAVADNKGLSYWSEAAELVAYAAPVWQLLPLEGGAA